MFSGLQNSVKEQVENILYYMKKANEGEQNMARDEVPQGAENGKGYAEASCCNEKGNRSAAGNEDQVNEDQVNERCGREHDADEGGSRLSSPAQEKAKNKGVDEGTPRSVFDATPYTGQESAPVFDCTPNYSAQPFDAPLMTGIMEGHVLSASAVIAEGSRKHRVKVSATKPRKVCTRRKFGSIGDHGTGSKGGDEAGPDDEWLVKRKRSSISEMGDLHVEIAPSPFDLKYELPGRLRQVAYDKYKDIMSKKGTVLQSAWIKLEDPWFMEVTGAQLQASFNDNAAISTVLMSVVVRLIQHEDTAMYIKHGSKHKQWRHFMPPEFSDLALASGEFRITSEVRDMFLGRHIDSMFEYCRMVAVPSNRAGYWSLYLWDMEEMVLHVFDPVIKAKDPEQMWALHGGFVLKIANALTACAKTFFPGWQHVFEDFAEDFFVIEGEPVKSCDSGVYIVHYMRWFDGQNIVQPISQRIAKHVRRTLPYEVLTMRCNTGSVPQDLITTVDLT
ncbi:unnamed protein product [Urochloa humidicola]